LETRERAAALTLLATDANVEPEQQSKAEFQRRSGQSGRARLSARLTADVGGYSRLSAGAILGNRRYMRSQFPLCLDAANQSSPLLRFP